MTQQLATTLEVRRTAAAPLETVFQAWTDPEMLKKWWRVDAGWSTPIAEVDLRVGGRYRLGMFEPGKDGPYVVGGVYREVTPPEKLVFTWIWDGPGAAEETLVTVDFLDQGDATEVILAHQNFADQNMRDEHQKGWGGCLTQLASLVENLS